MSVLCLLQAGCSLGPASARIAHNAFDERDYRESLRLANRALTIYEYSAEDKASLLLLKANNYRRLREDDDADGIINYLIDTFPNTEAGYRAKAQLAAKKKKSSQGYKTKMRAKSVFNSDLSSHSKIIWPIVMVEQKYPAKAAQKKIEGTVELTFDISETGKVINISVIESNSSKVFVPSAKKALKMWRYNPVKKQNKSIVSKGHRVVLGFEFQNKRANFTVKILA